MNQSSLPVSLRFHRTLQTMDTSRGGNTLFHGNESTLLFRLSAIILDNIHVFLTLTIARNEVAADHRNIRALSRSLKSLIKRNTKLNPGAGSKEWLFKQNSSSKVLLTRFERSNRTKRACRMISLVRMKDKRSKPRSVTSIWWIPQICPNIVSASVYRSQSESGVSRVLPYTQFYLRPDKFAVNNDRRAIINHWAQQMVFLHGNLLRNKWTCICTAYRYTVERKYKFLMDNKSVLTTELYPMMYNYG